MPRSAVQVRSGLDRTSLYHEITGKIIAELEAGRLPWVQPWGAPGTSAPLGLPKNVATGRRYSGINVLILWGAIVQRGFLGHSWLTFRQTLGLGGHVRRGETGTTVVYADRFVPEGERERAGHRGDGEADQDALRGSVSRPNQAIPFLKRFTVFNADQCEGLPDAVATTAPPPDAGLILPDAEALIRAAGADLRLGGDRAFYSVVGDYIQIPLPQAYFEPVNWHRTAFHELGHNAAPWIMPHGCCQSLCCGPWPCRGSA
jgi:antirestriction protein ArdC